MTNSAVATPQKRKYTPRKPVERVCGNCGTYFMSSGTNVKWCGMTCKESVRYRRDREKRLMQAREYRKANEHRIKASVKARYWANRERNREANRENYLRNRDARIKYAVEYQKNNPEVVALTRHRRKAQAAFKITRRDHRRLLQRYGNKCAYCSVDLKPWGREFSESLQWDHVVPLSKNGNDSIGNILPSCRSCNYSKSATLLSVWRYSTHFKKEA